MPFDPALKPMLHLGASVVFTDEQGIDHAAIVGAINNAEGWCALSVFPATASDILNHSPLRFVPACKHAYPVERAGQFHGEPGTWHFRISDEVHG